MAKYINYSIIIPHKNIPELLQRCLDSIPRREDIQIIVVDDNSDPTKVNFDKFPGLHDPFVEVVFTKEGKGAGYARNVGLTKAIGKWLLFADADDFFNYCVNDILDEYVNSDADIIWFKCNSLDSVVYTPAYRSIHLNIDIDYWLYFHKKAEILLKYGNTVIWAKIFKRELITKNSILFDEVSIYNDNTFMYLSAFYANVIYADSRALYCVTLRQNSIQFGEKTIENKLDRLYVGAKRYRFFRKNGIPNSVNVNLRKSLIELIFNRAYFYKSKNIFSDLDFTPGEIIRLCIFNLIIFLPIMFLINVKKVIMESIYCNRFLLRLFLKFIKIFACRLRK